MYAVSFCLYGPPNPKYYDGLLRNIEQIHMHFPGWVIYVYTGADVSQPFLDRMTQSGVRLRPTGKTGPILMMYRFLAIDEPDIDVMMVREFTIAIALQSKNSLHPSSLHMPFEITHIIPSNSSVDCGVSRRIRSR